MAGQIVHEWLAPAGGSENVVERFAGVFPDARITALWNDAPERFDPSRVDETWIAQTPLRRSKASALPFMLPTWRAQRLDVEWLLVSSHLFAHHVSGALSTTPKYVYVHTPARYIWEPTLDDRGAGGMKRVVASILKTMDRSRVGDSASTSIVANSQFIADRITRTWGDHAAVIYPPVNVQKIQSETDWRDVLFDEELRVIDSLPSEFLLGASRFVSYKRLELVIRAGESTKTPVVLAGGGPDDKALRDLAKTSSVPVHFVARPRDEMLYALYQRATVFVFPPIEDFGIMPVEAMAAGTPAVVNPVGGASESVGRVGGGSVFDDESDRSLADAVETAASLDRGMVAHGARFFDAERFDREIRAWVRPDEAAAHHESDI